MKNIGELQVKSKLLISYTCIFINGLLNLPTIKTTVCRI